jgi:DNA-binding Lrp family transcriptional regulator
LVQAYVLVTAAIGKVRKVASEIEKIEGVKSAKVVTGPYDIVVLLEAKDLSELTTKIVEDIHKIEGVVDTNTAIVVEF